MYILMNTGALGGEIFYVKSVYTYTTTIFQYLSQIFRFFLLKKSNFYQISFGYDADRTHSIDLKVYRVHIFHSLFKFVFVHLS